MLRIRRHLKAFLSWSHIFCKSLQTSKNQRKLQLQLWKRVYPASSQCMCMYKSILGMSIFFRTCRSPQTLSYVRPFWYDCVGVQICKYLEIYIFIHISMCLCCSQRSTRYPMQPFSVSAFFGRIYFYGRLRASVSVLPLLVRFALTMSSAIKILTIRLCHIAKTTILYWIFRNEMKPIK